MSHSQGSNLLSRLSKVGRVLICAEFAAAVAAIVYLGFHLFGVVFTGAPSALPVRFDGLCESSDPASPCSVSTIALTPGRYRVATDVPSTKLTLLLSPQTSVERARVLLVRLAQPKELRLEVSTGHGVAPPFAPVRIADVGVRTVTSWPASAAAITELSFVPHAGTAAVPFVLDEVGFFEERQGLLSDVRPIFQAIPPLTFYGTLVPRAILPLCIFTAIAAFVVPGSILRKFNPALLSLVCFAFCLLDLAILFSPYGPGDLRSFYASGPLQEPAGMTLNEGLWLASHLLQGQGLTISPGVVPWERMPGYGLFCALAGLLFRGRTLLELGIDTILLQVVLYSAAVGFFAWAAGLLWRPSVVWTLGLLIALLPKQLGYTQVDSMIAPMALLVSAALCIRLKALQDGRPVGLALEIFVHLTFALWFLMRPDVLPGWLSVSLILHWRNWRRLLIPLVLFLTVGIGWGAYKARYTREFTLTTSSVGASLFCGLWEVPSRFAFTCSDETYFKWIGEHTSLQRETRAASNFTMREVFKFWLTFPGHFVIMLDHKMMAGLDGNFWPGLRTDLQRSTDLHRVVSRVLSRPIATLLLLTIIVLCFVDGYQRRRTLLLGWPLSFNLPLFLIMFSSFGRFYGAVPIGLLAAAVPPLFEQQFYACLVARPWRTVSVVACAAVFAATAWPFHDWLLRNDSFHYWTPFLDPAKSLLSDFK